MAAVTETNPSDWMYVSEGGATIVFSYRGPPHPVFDGTVLRLRKCPIPSSESSKTVTSTLYLDGEEPDDPTIEYQIRCMERLVPPEHLPRLQTVHLDKSWLEQLARIQNDVRPIDRREKDEVDTNRKKGVLATDLVGGDWLAVEIKPKWGFLPSPVHLSEETKALKTQTCRFCMHTHLRVQKGQESFTDYCPLDLFSGDKDRIIKAIRSLWDAWVASNATVNNLKIFARGKFLLPSDAFLMLKNGAADNDLDNIRDAFSNALLRPLLQTPVLKVLSKLQRDLDALDIEGLSQLWKSTTPSSPIGASSWAQQYPEPGISDWVNFLDKYLDPNKPILDHSKPLPEHLQEYIMSYLLSATFKDCSIIVRLDFLEPSKPPTGSVASNSVTVIDLDPKDLKKLKSWEKLDLEIARNYVSAETKKRCLDAWQSPK
ncbi:hypothetical protein D9613_003135 [Agrocybe pediades]|uniref:Inositol-pentakisphosphate 2-kinase n=1 Tax=Agrocybe pediades TaxID=84607 RepID=A0A8H4QRJ7_9AGAR|nr:hypothetical protein D9613_003135 [Agrocybe pediades]